VTYRNPSPLRDPIQKVFKSSLFWQTNDLTKPHSAILLAENLPDYQMIKIKKDAFYDPLRGFKEYCIECKYDFVLKTGRNRVIFTYNVTSTKKDGK
jgi:hypothetical protein